MLSCDFLFVACLHFSKEHLGQKGPEGAKPKEKKKQQQQVSNNASCKKLFAIFVVTCATKSLWAYNGELFNQMVQ